MGTPLDEIDLPITGNIEIDYRLQGVDTEVIITGPFDGSQMEIVTTGVRVPEDEAPIDGGTVITSAFTGIYEGQVHRTLRFKITGVGAGTKIDIHTGPTTDG